MPEGHVLVGGLGFLGTNLALLLQERGHRVVVVARRSGYERRRDLARILEAAGVEIMIVDSVGPDHVKGAEVVYHLAGKPGGPLRVNLESHVHLLERELEGAAETGSRLVYVSSIGVVADASPLPPGSVVREEETHLWGLKREEFRERFSSVHSYTKALGERTLVEKGSELGGKWAIVRPALVYGPYAYHQEWKTMRIAARLWMAPSSRRVPVVNVVDVAELLYEAGTGAYDGSWVNAVAEGISLSDVSRAICRSMGRSRCMPVPVDLMIALGRLAPYTSPSRLAWSIVRKKYSYRSRVLSGREWRLEPVL